MEYETKPMKLRTFCEHEEQMDALKALQKRYKKIYKKRRSLNDFVREGIRMVLSKYKGI